MKTLKLLLVVLITVTSFLNCKDKSTPEVKTVGTVSEKKLDPNATYVKTEFNIEGMTCAMGCAATIQKKIGAMDGVKSSIVDFDKKLAMIEYDVKMVTPESIKNAVAKVGDAYKVGEMKIVEEFSISNE